MSEIARKQNDTTPITGELTENGSASDLSNASKVEFFMTEDTNSDPKVSGEASIVDAANGEVRYHFSSDEVDEAGIFLAEWQVTYANGTIHTFPNTGYMRIRFDEDLS